MAKGDKISVTYELGDGKPTMIDVIADGVGRTVEFNRDEKKNLLTIEVAGRAGTATRTVHIRLDKVLMLEEIPA